MFVRVGRVVAHRPRVFVAVWVVLVVLGYALAVGGVHGENLFDRLTAGAPSIPGSESAQGLAILDEADQSGVTLTLALQGIDPTDPAVDKAMDSVRAELTAIDGVASVIDPLGLPDGAANPAAAPLVAKDGNGFLVVVSLDPNLSKDAEAAAVAEVHAQLQQVPSQLQHVAPGVTGVVGGTPLIVDAITQQVQSDLRTGEAIALPIALVVMVLVFGGFLAASMPMAGAIASISGGLAALLAFSYAIDLDSSVVNIVTVLGLGLSIDYGLLMVSRFREELHRIVDDDGGRASRRRRGDGAVIRAIERTMGTAGRTVTFSALTVAIAIAGLVVFDAPILRAFGLAGVAVIVVALLSALTLVPALMTLAGRRLIHPSILDRVPGLRVVLAHTSDVQTEEGFFSRLTGRVQRHPWWVVGATVVTLGVLAVPLAHLEVRNSTTQLLPAGSTQRQFVEILASDYPGASTPPITVVAQTSLAEATTWAATLKDIDGVASVDTPTPVGSYVMIGVRTDTTDPGDATSRKIVEDIRALDAPFPTWVVGQAASQIDFTAAVVARAPLAIAIVALATLVLLFLMTGSVVVPVQALLISALSLGASLGVMVWVFQDGHLSGLLDFTPTGGIETYVVVLVIAFGFGLAMDYEVFLLSRIKELVDHGVPNDEAVRLGMQRSGRIITSAALIVIVVFAGFVAGKLLVIKEVGFSLAIAVLIDATIVRLLLVPATMTVLGRYNWWAPRFLRRLHDRIGIVH